MKITIIAEVKNGPSGFQGLTKVEIDDPSDEETSSNLLALTSVAEDATTAILKRLGKVEKGRK